MLLQNPRLRKLLFAGCSAAGVFCCACLYAQNPAPPPAAPAQTTAEMVSSDSTPTFSTGINLVLVPVVIRDANGKAIGTLTKDDFQLFDRGKPVTIAKFSVEKSETPPILPDTSIQTDEKGNPVPKTSSAGQPVASHFIMWLFDDMHLSFGDLAQTREAAKKVLRESFEPGSRAAVYTTSGHTYVDFTDDRDKLNATMDQIKPWPTIPGNDATGNTTGDCPNVSYFEADRALNANDPQALQAVQVDFLSCPVGAAAVGNANAGMASGKVSAAAASAYVQSQTSSQVRMELIRDTEIDFQDTRNTLLVLKQLIKRMSAMPGSRTIVMVSPGFYLVDDHRADETDIINNAIRNNVIINSLDARGLFAMTPGGTADTPLGNADPNTMAIKQNYDRQSQLANQDILEELAKDTGGLFFHDNNDFAGGLKIIATQPEYIYVLGFAPQGLKFDGSYHKLKVALKNSSGLQILARRGYFERHHAQDASEQAKEDIQEAFFSRDDMSELPVQLNTQFFKTGEDKAKLSVLARVDVKRLRFRKVDGRNNNTLTVVSGIFDRDGNYVSGTQKIVQMKLKDQTLEKLPDSGITVKSTLDVAPGSYVVRLVVRDSEGQMMSAKNSSVEIP